MEERLFDVKLCAYAPEYTATKPAHYLRPGAANDEEAARRKQPARGAGPQPSREVRVSRDHLRA